mgnify:CR=1 FL=1
MYSNSSGGIGSVIGTVIGIIVGILLCGVVIGSCGSLNGSKSGPTEVIVERNGGPFDSKDIRGVKGPASPISIHGLMTQNRHYIAGNEQRYYSISSDPSQGSQTGTSIQVPTKDGVNVGVDGQILFRTAFTTPDGEFAEEQQELLKQFDTNYGNRNFKGADGDSKKVWEGNDGWNAFLNTMIKPVVENAFREQIGAVNCADLVSSCALVQSSNNQQQFVVTDATSNEKNFNKIQQNVQQQIEEGIAEALGDTYLSDFKVQLTKVTLPENVQSAIDVAQASFADIAKARAQNVQSRYQAQANERLAAAYEQSPALAQIKIAEELADNSNATIIVGSPGMGFNLGK